MKLKLIILLLIAGNTYGQKLELIYESQLDSNKFIEYLKNVNGELFFNSGNVIQPMGYGERNVYKLDIEQKKATLIFRHNHNNSRFLNKREYQSDSTIIYYESIFFETSDTSGIFYSNNMKNHYWVKNKETYEKIVYPESAKMKSFEPFDLNDGHTLGNTMKFSRDSFNSQLNLFFNGLLDYLKSNDKKINEENLFEVYQPLYDNGGFPKWSNPDEVYVRLTSELHNEESIVFEVDYWNPNYRVDPLLINKTELWKYDKQSGRSEVIYRFAEPGSIHSCVEFNNNYFISFVKETSTGTNKLDDVKILKIPKGYKESNEKIFEGKMRCTELILFDDKVYFTSLGRNDRYGISYINKKNEIKDVCEKFQDVYYIELIDKRLLFIGSKNKNECKEVYELKRSTRTKKLTDICMKDDYYLLPEKILGKTYIVITKENNSFTTLYLLKRNKLKHLINNVGMDDRDFVWNELDKAIFDNVFYLVSYTKTNGKYNALLWRMK